MVEYIIKKGLWYFEIIDTKTNTIVGTQETYSKAKKIFNKITKKGTGEYEKILL